VRACGVGAWPRTTWKAEEGRIRLASLAHAVQGRGHGHRRVAPRAASEDYPHRARETNGAWTHRRLTHRAHQSADATWNDGEGRRRMNSGTTDGFAGDLLAVAGKAPWEPAQGQRPARGIKPSVDGARVCPCAARMSDGAAARWPTSCRISLRRVGPRQSRFDDTKEGTDGRRAKTAPANYDAGCGALRTSERRCASIGRPPMKHDEARAASGMFAPSQLDPLWMSNRQRQKAAFA